MSSCTYRVVLDACDAIFAEPNQDGRRGGDGVTKKYRMRFFNQSGHGSATSKSRQILIIVYISALVLKKNMYRVCMYKYSSRI